MANPKDEEEKGFKVMCFLSTPCIKYHQYIWLLIECRLRVQEENASKKRPFEASGRSNRPGSNGEAEKSNHIVLCTTWHQRLGIWLMGAFTRPPGSDMPCSSFKLHELSWTRTHLLLQKYVEFVLKGRFNTVVL